MILSTLLVSATMAFAMNIPRDLYPFQGDPFHAPRWNSPVPSGFIGKDCEYNAEFDYNIELAQRPKSVLGVHRLFHPTFYRRITDSEHIRLPGNGVERTLVPGSPLKMASQIFEDLVGHLAS
jgi:hypothetical protein